MCLTGKLSQVGGTLASSPDSSSDSSTGGSPRNTRLFDEPNREAEMQLPGVLMSMNPDIMKFLLQICDLGIQLEDPVVRDNAWTLLKIIPADAKLCSGLLETCGMVEGRGDVSKGWVSPLLEELLFTDSPNRILYHLEVCYSLMMPANHPLSDETFQFQSSLLRSGGLQLLLRMLTRDDFMMTADLHTRRSAYMVILRLLKPSLIAVGHAYIKHIADSIENNLRAVAPEEQRRASLLQEALHFALHPGSDMIVKNAGIKLGQSLTDQMCSFTPDLPAVRALQKISWTSAFGAFELVHVMPEEIQRATDSGKHKLELADDESLCVDALELLTLSITLIPSSLDQLNKERTWQSFIIDVLLRCSSRPVRISAVDNFHIMAVRCSSGQRPLLFFITLLFTVLDTKVRESSTQCQEYFRLLAALLHFAFEHHAPLSNTQALLNNQLTWIKNVRDSVAKMGEPCSDDFLLEGHLSVTRALVQFLPPQKKFFIGSDENGPTLIKDLLEDFVFPASKVVIAMRRSGQGIPDASEGEHAIPVCNSSIATMSAFRLLSTLCLGSVANLKKVADMITEMYLSPHDPPLVEWEYIPPIGARPTKGFVGLKNAGATCYMNSVIQQLFMIDTVRTHMLSVETSADLDIEELEKTENEGPGGFTGPQALVTPLQETDAAQTSPDKPHGPVVQEDRKEYNLKLLQFVQLIFGHLACSKMQYYVPRAFWKHFRLQGEPVNLREQHDAHDFFISLVDSLDEALKALSKTPVFSKVMGGSFADQKICKGCPHRYSREESFLTLNIDIRNQHNLLESLEQYVKGDLLEGANAYHCERCNAKVDTVKRMCIKKLPSVLAIQLKRFDYDWERECAIKFNDYFEFPREFDMEPFTVHGLAKIEGEAIPEGDNESEKVTDVSSGCTKYRLVGVVVHSGQASGGHYYSFILHRLGNEPKWYRFDDGEVSECRMDDDEEMKNQCFGGEYFGEVFDHNSKSRKQKRWWNAYILFYERMDEEIAEVKEDLLTKSMQDLTLDNRTSQVHMPRSIEKMVHRQNLNFAHCKTLYSGEFFHFIRDVLAVNHSEFSRHAQGVHPKLGLSEQEEVSQICIQLGSKFIFNIALHTKKYLRGPANDWYDTLAFHLHSGPKVRRWFTQSIFFNPPGRLAEYLLECPSSEVRSAVMRLIVFLAHFSHSDGATPGITPLSDDPKATLSDHLILNVLQLLKKEVSENGRHLAQYFHLFVMYANLGGLEKQHLLRLDVPLLFMHVALDEGPGPPIKYQYTELTKLYAVVSLLIRCYDLSESCSSSNPDCPALPNPNCDPNHPLMPIPKRVAELLFNKTGYVKKVLEDAADSEETAKLLRHCIWENSHFSATVLSELLWQVAYSYTYELRPYLDLLLQILILEDSWQSHRIHNALMKGIPDDRDGLFDTINRSKNSYQKRGYLVVKMLVSLFSHCPAATEMMQTNKEIRYRWRTAVDWLHQELERRPYGGSYSSWSPHAQSNETSNGFFLERSPSAKLTLNKAIDLCPDDDLQDREEQQQQEKESRDPPAYPQQRVSPIGQDSRSDETRRLPSIDTGGARCPPSSHKGIVLSSIRDISCEQQLTGEEMRQQASTQSNSPLPSPVASDGDEPQEDTGGGNGFETP